MLESGKCFGKKLLPLKLILIYTKLDVSNLSSLTSSCYFLKQIFGLHPCWVEEYHMDGFKFHSLSSMIYTHNGLASFTGDMEEHNIGSINNCGPIYALYSPAYPNFMGNEFGHPKVKPIPHHIHESITKEQFQFILLHKRVESPMSINNFLFALATCCWDLLSKKGGHNQLFSFGKVLTPSVSVHAFLTWEYTSCFG
ncbi:hypothetical protein M9H77_36497 [Catharanthus roseus]|uniref:Uncharacterized protein n=1 Tax=Catharanthus roseus TaxID=4058 RepID=A0ACB9ZW88_CATRO|nr:hypothetical protein M9H77_36497 [Catharanthus roseus]